MPVDNVGSDPKPTKGGKKSDATVIREKIVYKHLFEEKNPALGGDLDGMQKDIKNIKNLETQLINGKDVFEEIRYQVERVKDTLGQFAERKHFHPEIDQLFELIEKESKGFQRKGDYAEADHKHNFSAIEGMVDLDQVQDGEKIKSLIADKFAPLVHEHDNYKASIDSLVSAVAGLHTTVSTMQSHLAELSQATTQAIDSLEGQINELKKNMPVVPEPPPVEVIGVRFVIIPEKADGKKIKSISAFDQDGKKANVTITKKGEKYEVGSKVKVDDVLHISPPCLVRLSFS